MKHFLNLRKYLIHSHSQKNLPLLHYIEMIATMFDIYILGSLAVESSYTT